MGTVNTKHETQFAGMAAGISGSAIAVVITSNILHSCNEHADKSSENNKTRKLLAPGFVLRKPQDYQVLISPVKSDVSAGGLVAPTVRNDQFLVRTKKLSDSQELSNTSAGVTGARSMSQNEINRACPALPPIPFPACPCVD